MPRAQGSRSHRALPPALGLWLAAATWAMPPDPPPAEPGTVLRIVLPAGRQLSGRTPIETLTIEADIARVVFYLDGEEVAAKRLPPYNVKVNLASPPREQTVRAEAFDRKGRPLGADEIVVNRAHPPLRVRITALERGRGDELSVRADLSLPRKTELARFELYLNDQLKTIRSEVPFEARLAVPSPGPGDFVRLVAVLADGRAVEDVEAITSPGLAEKVDVNLVQLQVLVSRRDGSPVSDLDRDDFEIVERGDRQEIDRLYVASDVALNLGLVLDSSGSMAPAWETARGAAEELLKSVMTPRDRAFLVDFDTRVRLVQPLTGEPEAISESLGRIEPDGGTALYDSILFSLLQFEDEPGRRALVVLTDGYDAGSTSHPRRSVEVARALGVPLYVVILDGGDLAAAGPTAGPVVREMPEVSRAADLKLLTEPTGGRLIHIGSATAIVRAFAHIDAELRSQYVLTYYSDDPPAAHERDEISVRVPGRPDALVRTVWALDQVN